MSQISQKANQPQLTWGTHPSTETSLEAHKFLAAAFDHGSTYHGFKLLVQGHYPPIGLPWLFTENLGLLP